MSAPVYFGSARQARLAAEETLPAKLDKILDELHIRDRVKGETVAIKMHIGGNIGYSTVHPVFVRKVVNAVKEGGGKPFVCDLPGGVQTSYTRGYTKETLGCDIVSVIGPNEKYIYWYDRPFKNIQRWGLGGFIHDATFLIDLAHVKGHPSCGFGGCIKNLALGAFAQETRGLIHDTMHFRPYWHKEKCPDAATRKKILASCPFGALVEDTNDPEEVHIHFDNCNQCKRCLEVAPDGCLEIHPENFHVFQEACAIAVEIALSTFDPDKQVFLNIATQMTPVCDCFGFTGLSILPDLGVFGSNNILAIEQAVLDEVAKLKVMPENLPLAMEHQPNAGHPFQQVQGPYKDPYLVIRECVKNGMGSTDYDLIDIMPVKMEGALDTYIPA